MYVNEQIWTNMLPTNDSFANKENKLNTVKEWKTKWQSPGKAVANNKKA